MRSTGRSHGFGRIVGVPLVLILFACTPLTDSPDGPDEQPPIIDPFAFDPSTDSLTYVEPLVATGSVLESVASLVLYGDDTTVYAASDGSADAQQSTIAFAPVGNPWTAEPGVPSYDYTAVAAASDFVVAAAGTTLAVRPGASAAWQSFRLSGGLAKESLLSVAASAATFFVGTTGGLFSLPAADAEASMAGALPVADEDDEIVDLFLAENLVFGVIEREGRKGEEPTQVFAWEPGAGTWTSGATATAPERFGAIASDGSTVYVGTGDGILVGPLAGPHTTHSLVPAGGSGPTSVRDVTVHAGVVYAATNNGLWLSTDDGVSWTVLTADDGLPSNDWHSVVAIQNRVYVACNGLGIAELIWQ